MQPRFPLEFIDAERDLAVINWDKCAKRPTLCGEPENPLGHVHDYVWRATELLLGHCQWRLSEHHACRRCSRLPDPSELSGYTFFFVGVDACDYHVARSARSFRTEYLYIADPSKEGGWIPDTVLREMVETYATIKQCRRCSMSEFQPVKSKLL